MTDTLTMIDLVKPLEWVDHPINGEPILSMAGTLLGTYFICDDTDDFSGLYCELVTHKDATWFGSIKADNVLVIDRYHADDCTPLKAAAQTDYNERILSALNLEALPVWQPIETAPMDGTKFDAWCVNPEHPGKGVRITDVQMRGDGTGLGTVVHTRHGVEWHYIDARDRGSIFPPWRPTHWMPIPTQETPND